MPIDERRTGENAGLQYLAGLHAVLAVVAGMFRAQTPAVAQAADGSVILGECLFAGVVTSVEFIPNADLTGADDNTRLFEVINRKDDNSGSTVVASLQFDEGEDLSAREKKVITLSATPANLVVEAGDVLEFVSSDVGTGLADPGGVVIVKTALS